MTTTNQSYKDGYCNGAADRLLGQRLIVALESPDKEYARGYAAGNAGRFYCPQGVTSQ